MIRSHHHFRKRLPSWRPARIALGIALLVGGLFGFLPILGFWMIPLGFAVLAVDIPFIRRWRRRAAVWWARRTARRRDEPEKREADE